MIDFSAIQGIIADAFFSGDTSAAGVLMFLAALAVIFAMFHTDMLIPFALMLPVTFIFTLLGILPTTFTILMVIVSVVGLSRMAKDRVV